MSSIKDVPMVMVPLLLFKVWGLAYRDTDSHVTTKIFEIDGLANFLRYGAPLARLHRSGAPLFILSRLQSSNGKL